MTQAVEAIMANAVRRAFELGWRAADAGQTLSEALALYDREMAKPLPERQQ